MNTEGWEWGEWVRFEKKKPKTKTRLGTLLFYFRAAQRAPTQTLPKNGPQ